MSYCRFGEGDVYVFFAVGGYLECCGCTLSVHSFCANCTEEMVAHLEGHQRAGHHVPDDVIPALRRDDAENFPP